MKQSEKQLLLQSYLDMHVNMPVRFKEYRRIVEDDPDLFDKVCYQNALSGQLSELRSSFHDDQLDFSREVLNQIHSSKNRELRFALPLSLISAAACILILAYLDVSSYQHQISTKVTHMENLKEGTISEQLRTLNLSRNDPRNRMLDD